MNRKELIQEMADSVGTVPAEAEILAVRRYSFDDLGNRAKRFLATTVEAYDLPFGGGDWVVQEDRTLVRLPLGGRAVVYHASGAMKIISGLGPMESLFNGGRDPGMFQGLVEKAADRLKIREWVGQTGSLSFERLWQIKAAAVDREGTAVEPVLCRVVGAYRHFVGELPVWGAASVAITLARGGMLDSVKVQLRECTGEVIDRAQVFRPDRAAHQILLQLDRFMGTGESKLQISKVAVPQWLRFGYLSLPKRKAQTVLAPMYVAAISIEGKGVSQAHLLAVPATETRYLPLGLDEDEAPLSPLRRQASRI